MVIIMDIINIGDMKRGEIMDLNEDKIDLTQYFNRFYISLRKLKKWLLLLIVVCFLFMEVRTMFFFETTYSSRAVFIAYQSEQTNIFSQSDDNDDLVTTFNRLLTGNMMQEIICQELNVSSVPGQISLSRLTDTNLINLTVTAADPQDAYDVINCIINNYGQVTEIVMSDVSLSLLDTPQLATSPDAYPDYIKSFYEIATRFGYNEIGMIKDSIELLGLLKNPNQNKDTIHRLLQLPVIDDISFDSKDTFSIFSEKLGDFRFTLVTEALKDNQELMEYLEEAPFAHLCYLHTAILSQYFKDNFSEVSLCRDTFGNHYYHAYSISPDRKTVFDLTYNGIFSLEDYERLENPSPIYSEQHERLILDIGYALDNSGLDPDTEWLLQAALYRTYLDKIDYHGPMREAPKVMQK